MSILQQLYQELILDHNKRPRNRRTLEQPDRTAQGYNPLCGDRVRIYIKLSDDVIDEVTFEGSGCAISTASASLLSEALRGKTVAQAEALYEKFHDIVTGETTEMSGEPDLGKLEALTGVTQFPARVKCATLAWHTLIAALHSKDEVVTTE